MKFKYTNNDQFTQMLEQRLQQLELKYKESQHNVALIKMIDPPPPNVADLVRQQEEMQHELDKSYANVEDLLAKERGDTKEPSSNGKKKDPPIDVSKLAPNVS